ncbi:MAG: hypothetical protein JF607_16770 [Burkholderiales bacterium]|jgi:hypothetical protein|nr:hypothetical protein [Burkholderiales bacterium]
MRFLSMIRVDETAGQAPSMAEAVALTRRFLGVHGSDWDIECEVRPLDGPEFGCRP